MDLTRYEDNALQVLCVTLQAKAKPTVTLFPMVHVGRGAFFTQVAKQANTHDIVLYEGVNASAGRAANRAYRIASFGGSPIQSQSRAIPKARGAHTSDRAPKWVNSDIAPNEFKALWRDVPLWLRLLFYIVMPVLGVVLRFKKVRRWMAEELGKAQHSEDDDLEIFGKELHTAIITARDKALLESCNATIASGEHDRIAVVWGAKHMPPLLRALKRLHGYRVTGQVWLTVFHTDAIVPVKQPQTHPVHIPAETTKPSDHRG